MDNGEEDSMEDVMESIRVYNPTVLEDYLAAIKAPAPSIYTRVNAERSGADKAEVRVFLEKALHKKGTA